MTTQSQTPATIASIQQFSFFNPTQFDTMQRVAKMFSNSELVPDMYRISENNPAEKATANCIIAIDIANRVEANILMVMQNLVIIYGRPTWSSKFLIGTVNTCGRFEPMKFKIDVIGEIKDYKYSEYVSEWKVNPSTGKKYKDTKQVEKVFKGPIDNLQCIAYTSIKGSDTVLESSPVSIKMALDEGWYTKAGSKWPNMPKQMLLYRAASFWTNAYAPELSLGMKTTEEVQDFIDVDYEEVKTTTEKPKANSESIGFDDPKGLSPETNSGPKPNTPPVTEKVQNPAQPKMEF